MNMFAFLRRQRCVFRLNHDWTGPFIDGKSIVHVCRRCGKRVERILT